MREILFSKYSIERSPQFAIRTSIVRDGQRRWVEKIPMTQDAAAHVEKLASSYDALSRTYEGTKVRPCPVVVENGIAKFDFMDGEFFHEKLERLIAEKDEEGILALCERFVSIVRSSAHVEEFQKTPEFVHVFGDVELPDGLMALPFSNVDWVFENLIEEENGDIALIDYEWCFDFPIPLEYTLYRSLYVTFMKFGQSEFVNRVLCSKIGISETLIPGLWQMEAGFTRYVAQGECFDAAAWYEYIPILQGAYDWQEEIERNRQEWERQRQDLLRQHEALREQLAQAKHDYNVISNAFFWKVTKPARVMTDRLKTVLQKNNCTRKLYKKLRNWKHKNKVQDYWNSFTPKELEQQKRAVFPKKIKFSILVPLYNTPEKFLHDMIQSVLDQTYGDWELCMADGSDGKHSDVGRICAEYAEKDGRIRYKKLENNLGISENTNACLEMATGNYVALLDHDDLLHPAALHEVMKAICEQNADFIYTDEVAFESPDVNMVKTVHFKSDFAPDTLRSYNYICHFTSFSRALLEKTGGGFRSDFDGSQDYDLVLRLTEQAEHVAHVPEILYFWRSHSGSVASDVSVKPYAISAAKKALGEHLERLHLQGEVLDALIPTTYRIRYEIQGAPLVSIIIPNKDHVEDLQKCITSILEKSTYSNWEIIVVENNSVESETFDYYADLQKDKRIKVVNWEQGFNYSAINNFGVGFAHGDYILLLNNDTEVITPDWLEQMLMLVQRKDVGVAGCMLYYPDDTVQHAGVILGIAGVAGHAHKHFSKGHPGYMCRTTITQNFSAVTGACMMVRRDVWDEVGGLDEEFAVALNDVDICLRIRKAGYLIAWTPYAELYHYESKSRGYEDTPEKYKRFCDEASRFQERWAGELAAGDPYYNPNLTLDREDFSLK